jgi:putative ABC transport system permease protein
MQEEIHSHLELAAEDFRRRGVPDELALREARLKDGEAGVAIDALRDQQGLPWVNDFKRDVGYAFRSLRRSPAFTVVSVISLALAIGTNTAMLSVINTVLLQPLPFRSPDRLVTCGRVRVKT